MTDSIPDKDAPQNRPKSLWAMMGTSHVESEDTSVESATSDVPKDESVQDSNANLQVEGNDFEVDEESKVVAGRGLWGVMSHAAPDESVAEPVESSSTAGMPNVAEKSPSDPADGVAKGRSLFSLMQKADIGAESANALDEDVASEEIASELREADCERAVSIANRYVRSTFNESEAVYLDETSDSESVDDEESAAGVELPAPFIPSKVEDGRLEVLRQRRALIQAVRQSWMAVFWGIGSIAVAAVALIDFVGNGVPAGMFGFGAVFAGYSALTGKARRNLGAPTVVVSLVGMLLGAAGLFLAPLYFAPLGRDMRAAQKLRETGKALETVGVGLKQYHDKHSAFPIGGTFARDASGNLKGQHGWMTFLLPYIGEQDLYNSIKLDVPFDDQVNRQAMGRDVPAYFSPHADRSKIVGGFSVAHFAGVGGEIINANGPVHLGIFERDEPVKRDEVTDGLSNTLVVGEIGRGFPPWGDPENWRKMGKGINRDPNGFGSVTNRGATFLLGDGSVRTFSNETDPKLLEKLSTRDGRE